MNGSNQQLAATVTVPLWSILIKSVSNVLMLLIRLFALLVGHTHNEGGSVHMIDCAYNQLARKTPWINTMCWGECVNISKKLAQRCVLLESLLCVLMGTWSTNWSKFNEHLMVPEHVEIAVSWCHTVNFYFDSPQTSENCIYLFLYHCVLRSKIKI